MTILPLRPNVCLLIRNSENLLFLGERAGHPGHWQFPQGGVEEEMTLEENALSEAHEELGADPSLFRVVTRLNATYEYEWDDPPRYGKEKWRGQKQTFWIMDFLGKDSDIDLENSDKEFMAYRWCTPEEVIKYAHPIRLKGYLAPLKEYELLQERG